MKQADTRHGAQVGQADALEGHVGQAVALEGLTWDRRTPVRGLTWAGGRP